MKTRRSGPFEIVQTENYVAVYYHGRAIYMSGRSEWAFDPGGVKGWKIVSEQKTPGRPTAAQG